MYIERTTRYDVEGEQRIRKARFLILVQPEYDISGKIPEPHALVRTVAMQQAGQFMTGKARVWGHTILLSGDYGARWFLNRLIGQSKAKDRYS